MLTQSEVKRLFDFNAETGVVTRLVTRGYRAKAGDTVGSINDRGYMTVKIINSTYMLHRVIWLWVYGEFPPHDIDHINGDRADNRLVNLRAVTRQENMKNRCLSKNNKSGTTGVYWSGQKKWLARS